MKSRKPYPGMGRWVVIMENYPGLWGAYRGAATEAKAREYAREMSHWPDAKVRIVENVAVAP